MLGSGTTSRLGGQKASIKRGEGHLILCGVDEFDRFCACMHGIGLDSPGIGVNVGVYAVAAGNIPGLAIADKEGQKVSGKTSEGTLGPTGD